MAINRSAKELVRHFINSSGLKRAHLALREARGEDVEHLRSGTLKERFSAIYQKRIWLNGRAGGSLSGLGSDTGNTNGVRRNLPQLLAGLGTEVLLDVGCGDFNWMRDIAVDCDYIGVDVVESVIEQNIKAYSSPNRTFRFLDATKDPLPQGDTVLCREVLFHLSFSDVWAVIRNVRNSGAARIVATTDTATAFNSDIISGDFRLLNLTRPPFRFPEPVLCIPDDEVSPGRSLAVWSVSDLPQAG